MEFDVLHKTRNAVTEYKKGYKNINMHIMDCYNGLQTDRMAKLASILFNMLIRSKMYPKKGEEHKMRREELNRIHTNIALTLEEIAMHLDPAKYSNGRSPSMDTSNIGKKIRKLGEYNIFYSWKYNKRYIFIMEREFGCWTYYNSKGVVIPKTLKKIVCLGEPMMKTMKKFDKEEGYVTNEKRMCASFGKFVNKMVNKMSPSVYHRLPLWDESKNIHEYLDELSKTLKAMDDYEGLVEDESFVSRLPPKVRWKLEDLREKEVNRMKDDSLEMEKELIPQNASLVRKPKRVKSKTKKTSPKKVKESSSANTEGKKPPLLTFGRDADPFKNCKEFVAYYRSALKHFNDGVKLGDFGVDTEVGGKVMDMLKENNRESKAFLDGWIKYYSSYFLRGKKVFSIKYTSMKEFKNTFKKYDSMFHVPH